MDERVLVTSVFHPDIVKGGAQRVAYDLFQGLRASGVDAYFLGSITEEVAPGLYKSGAWITGFNGRDNEFLLLQRSYDYFWHRSRDASAIERLASFLRKVNPTTVHIHHFFTFGMEFVALVRSVLPDARIVLTFHEFLAICYADGQMRKKTPSQPLCSKASPWDCHQCFPDIGPELFFLRERYFKDIFDDVDVFVAPTHFVKQRYVEWGLDPQRIAVISNPDTDSSRRLPLPRGSVPRGEGAITFAFLGQLVDNKGVDVLIRAVAELRRRGVGGFTVRIHGGNERFASDRMKELIAATKADHELSDIIEFCGEYTSDDLESVMEGIDVVVVPSTWWEIFCLVVTEAWRFGRPVLCSSVGGLKERVRDGAGGLTFRVGDEQALANAMERFMADPTLAETLAATIPVVPGMREVLAEHIQLFAAGGAAGAGRRSGDRVAV